MRKLIAFVVAASFSLPLTAKESTNLTDEIVSLMLFEAGVRASIHKLNGETENKAYKPIADAVLKEIYTPVNLNDMKAQIEDNELAAELEYSEPFIVTGYIDKITRSLGRPLIRIKNNDDNVFGNTTSAFFDDSDVENLAKLKTGEFITIACQSWSYSMSVSLKDCQMMNQYYQSFRGTIDAREFTEKACKDSQSQATTFFSNMDETLDSVSVEDKSEFINTAFRDERFFYTGTLGQVLESPDVESVVSAMKNLGANIKEKNGKLTKEDC